MVEKYKGVMPAGSIWYRLSRKETLTLLRHQGLLDNLTQEQIAALDSSELQGLPGKIQELEKNLVEAGLEIITLHD